jgi:HEAT repeat protein
LAFNHLITRRGVKMAFTVDNLARLIGADPQKLDQVLEKLEKSRILRGQSRQGVQWYELYHDLFSEPIEHWNNAFKAAERKRRVFIGAIMTVLVGLALYGAYDIGVNYTSYQLRLSVKRGISDAIELYRGKPGSLDILGLQSYIAETGYQRAQIEPDKLFTEKPIADFKTLTTDLIGHLPLVERIEAYWEGGEIHKALELAENSISEDDLQRSEAVIGILARFRSTKTVDGLKQQLTNTTNVRLREKITDGLGYIYVPQTVPALHLATTDSNPEVRGRAASALGRLGSPEAVKPLIPLLKDPDNDVRDSAAWALGQLGSPEAVKPLIPLLKDPDSNVRGSAAEALWQLGSPEAIETLITLLKDPDRYVRDNAASALGQLGSPEAVKPLIPLLKDPDRYVRDSAAWALGQLGRPEAVTPLIALLKDPDSDMRSSAAQALGQLDKTQVVMPLIEQLKIQSGTALRSILLTLGRLGDLRARDAALVIYNNHTEKEVLSL